MRSCRGSLQLVKKFPAFHGTPKVHYRTHKCPPPVSILSQLDPVHTPTSILILSSHLRLGLPYGLFPSGFPTKIFYTSLISPIHATCPAHLILLYLITRTPFCEQYRPFSCSLCDFLHCLSPRPISDPNILRNTPFSNTHSPL